ncbi:MAG: arginine repressor [Euzebyales bacterium]|nr:arginine repressor [Euzebyales bacterium]
MEGTRRRRERVRALVAEHRIGSQSELVELLRREGILATQPTASRDLEALGVIKAGRFYVLAEPGGLAQMLRQFASGIDASGNLAVVRTPPGVAGAVASAIDGAGLDGVLATVQGDDTVLVVAEEGRSGRDVADLLTRMRERNP